jgi:primary-amine oxidase
VTVANYEYLVYWRFYQDGNIECEVRATGIMVTSSFPRGGQPPTGALVDERTYAPYHQHFIVARLDLDIDGQPNTVYAVESEPLPVGDANPHGLALVTRETPLRTESDGRQDVSWSTQKGWKIASGTSLNGLGGRPAYKLVPSGSFPALIDESSPAFQRAQAIAHALWVTPYSPAEQWPCGEFPNQSVTDHGLPVWTARDRSIEDTDVVLWHVFGLHHISRPEDWPVMPVDRTGFWLKPWGFFDRNPALDVPPAPHGPHDR